MLPSAMPTLLSLLLIVCHYFFRVTAKFKLEDFGRTSSKLVNATSKTNLISNISLPNLDDDVKSLSYLPLFSPRKYHSTAYDEKNDVMKL